MRTTKAVREYLSDIADQLPCSRAVKKQFIKDLQIEIESSDCDQSSYIALCDTFGYPQEIAEGFKDADSGRMQYLLAQSRKRAWCVGCILAAVFLIAIITFVIFYIRYTMVTYCISPAIHYEAHKELFSWIL